MQTASDWYPHVTVATVVEKDHRFLTVHEQADDLEVYNQPAGHLEPGESLVEAAVRETREETGWLVEPTAVLGLSQFKSPINGITYLRTTFIARPLRELAGTKLDDGIIAAVWLTFEELEARVEQLRSPMVLDDIRQYQGGQRLPLELIRHYG